MNETVYFYGNNVILTDDPSIFINNVYSSVYFQRYPNISSFIEDIIVSMIDDKVMTKNEIIDNNNLLLQIAKYLSDFSIELKNREFNNLFKSHIKKLININFGEELGNKIKINVDEFIRYLNDYKDELIPIFGGIK